MSYQVLPPTTSPSVRSRDAHAELYGQLEALAPGEWLPVRCGSREDARRLGIVVQQRYRATRPAGKTRRCETKINGEAATIYLRLVPRTLEAR